MDEAVGREDPTRLMRDLSAAHEVLEKLGMHGLVMAASQLVQAVEALSRITESLERQRPQERLTPESAARYLGFPSVGAFERIVAKEGVPKHYLSDRLPRYSRKELDEWRRSR